MKKLITIALLLLAVTAFAASQKYYEYPDTPQLKDADRLLVYSNLSGSRNLTGALLKSTINATVAPDLAVVSGRATVLEATTAATTQRIDRQYNLSALRQALQDDFHSVVNIRFIGDSITWGMITTGQGVQDPRTQALTDPRNNLTSPSYVNLLRDYLGKKYAGGLVVADAPGSGFYQRTANISMSAKEITQVTAAGAPYAKAIGANVSTFLGDYTDIAVDRGIEFDFYGDTFNVHHVTFPGYGRFEVFVDGVSQGITNTDAALTWNSTTAISTTLGQHHVRIGNVDSGTTCRLTGLSWNKRVQIANDGIIGITSNEWKVGSANFTGSIQPYDEFVVINIGTNDRASTVAPKAATKLIANLTGIVDNLKTTQGKKVILIAPNQVTQSEAAYSFTQGTVVSAIEQVGYATNVPVVSCFTVAALSDGLHPNDAGHLDMFNKFVAALER